MNMMSKNLKLIIGLGNPGINYYFNRHNLGFLVLNNYLKGKGQWQLQSKFLSEVQMYNDKIFVKPQTFMNNSGESVSKFSVFYKIKPEEILVIHDEIDLEFGKMKISYDSSDAGHLGVRDIIKHLGTQSFYRLRFGVGRPVDYTPVDKFVLQDFTKEELEVITNFELGYYLS